jgi:hypothetical protein
MTTLDLHPEELFDKAARGAVSDDERALLDAHLAQCAVCRFERQAVADFAALPMPALNIDQLVTNALTAQTSASLRPPRRSRRVGALLAAAVALSAFGSFAAAAQWSGVLPRVIAALVEATRSAPPVAPPPRRPSPEPVVAPLEPVVAPAEDVVAPPAAVEEVVALPEPVAAPAERRAPAPAKHPPHLEAPPPPTASELFARGNRARLDGERAEAVSAYEALLHAFPGAVEAPQTHATLGRLLLDQGNPGAALEHLDAYLAGPDATLREDVLSARALAFMRLGREEDEVRAWQALLAAYPDSIHAARARARLGALDAGP